MLPFYICAQCVSRDGVLHDDGKFGYDDEGGCRRPARIFFHFQFFSFELWYHILYQRPVLLFVLQSLFARGPMIIRKVFHRDFGAAPICVAPRQSSHLDRLKAGNEEIFCRRFLCAFFHDLIISRGLMLVVPA